MKRVPWFEIVLIVAVMSMSLYAALSDGQNLSRHWFTRDDAYYYFKVAQNISEGHGSTFDGINKTNGYHPLWLLICIPIFALARFDLILPLRILLVVMSAISVATGILLYKLIGKIFTPAVGAITALFWVFSYEILTVVYQQGLETGIAAFFIVLLVYKLYEFEISWRTKDVSRKQIVELGIIATLTMFSRLDLVFLAGIVGIWVVFRKELLRYYVPLDIAAIIVLSLLAFLIRVPLLDYYDYVDLALTFTGLNLIVKLICAFFFGLYQRSILSRPVKVLKRLLLFSATSLIVITLLVLAALQLGLMQGSFSRRILLIDAGFTLIAFGVSRLMFTGLRTSRDVQAVDDPPVTLLLTNWKRWLSDGLLYYGVVRGALGVYMAWNRLAFGTSSPVSGQIKRWWATLPGRAYGGTAHDVWSFFGITYSGDANAWNPISRIMGHWAEQFQLWGLIDLWRYFLLLILCGIAFYLLLFINRKKSKTALTQLAVIPLFSSTWLQVLSYHAIGYSAFKDWYWITQLVVIVLTMSFIGGMFYFLLRKIPQVQILIWILAAYVGIKVGSVFWQNIRSNMQYHVWAPDAPYMEIVPLLEANTEPGSIIGMTGGGNPGYFIHDRTVLNMDGLINSYAYFQALQKREAGEFLNKLGLDYVLANPEILEQGPYRGQFDAYMDTLHASYGGKQLMRYSTP